MILQYSLRQPVIAFAGAHPDHDPLELRNGHIADGALTIKCSTGRREGKDKSILTRAGPDLPEYTKAPAWNLAA
jgi:hypothetical protein